MNIHCSSTYLIALFMITTLLTNHKLLKDEKCKHSQKIARKM